MREILLVLLGFLALVISLMALRKDRHPALGPLLVVVGAVFVLVWGLTS